MQYSLKRCHGEILLFMSLQQKLFQHYTAMIELLMNKKYNFAAYFAQFSVTRSKLNRKKLLFAKVNKNLT